MTTTSFDPRTLLEDTRLAILATIKSDGRPQLSPVMPHYDHESDTVYVAMNGSSAKAANMRRDSRVSLQFTSADGMAWATVDGTAQLTGPSDDLNGPEVEALVDYYRKAAGEHPDWDEFRAVMVADQRVLMTMKVDHVYGAKIA